MRILNSLILQFRTRYLHFSRRQTKRILHIYIENGVITMCIIQFYMGYLAVFNHKLSEYPSKMMVLYVNRHFRLGAV